MTPRGIKNHNPGNIRKSSDKWQGLSDSQTDPFFFQFESEVFGIRAMVKIFLTYQEKYNLKTISQLIGRWAPPTENDTSSYARHVAEVVGIEENCPIDIANDNICLPFLKGVILHENGQQPYTDDAIKKAIQLAYAQ